nr:hypothetical protein [Tanacetum cinerariifolium]
MSKSKKKSHKPKSKDTNQEKLYPLHMDLCGPMCVESVNGKKYILIIIDDRFIWVKCLRSKDEASDFIIKFLKMIQVRLKVGISHKTSVAHSSQQNGVIERRNRTLIEAACTMLIYAQALLFLWAEAVDTACYTQNRSIVRLHHGKTPYELLHGKLPDISFLHIFGTLCYPTNDSENLGKLQPKANIGPALHEMNPATISLGLMPKPTSSTPFVPPSRNDWDLLFQPLFDELLTPPPSVDPIAKVVASEPVVSTGSPFSTTVDQDAPSPKMQEELNKFERLEVWKHVPRPDKVMVITFKWIYKVKLDELGEEVCVSQLDGFVDPDNPNHVYKLKKALYGLKQAPRAWYDMLSSFPLSQDFSKGSVDPTLFICRNSNDLLLPVDQTYNLIYACVPDADHAGCQDTRCSASGSLQFLGDRLISWSSKRQKSVAISSTKAEYIALFDCCAQILWMRSQLTDYGLGFNKILIKTMNMTIDQQVALDEALVPHASRLRIGKSNFRLRSDIMSKESTLQVVYDVLKLTSFYKAFLVTTDVPEIYMQEFWATATVHHHSIRFKMNNKKRIINLEYFKKMLHICPRIPNQSFDELPFEEEILAFLKELGHSGEIKKITDVNHGDHLLLAKIGQKNELKARETLWMALSDKHQLKFNIHKDAKSLMEANEKKFGVSAVPSVFAGSTKALASILPSVDNLSDAELMEPLLWGLTCPRWNATIAIDEAILLENGGHLGTPGIKTLKEELFQWRLLLLMLWCHSMIELVAMIGAFRLMKSQQIMPLWHLPPQAHQVLIISGTPMATKHLDADLSGTPDCTSMSSAEAEYVSLSACCAQVLWMRTQLIDYGFHFDKIPMYCDSKAAIAISCNPVQHSRTKPSMSNITS